MKRKPTGFVAICQCGKVIGAIDINRTSQTEAGILLLRWLWDGCNVTPMFDGSWSVLIEHCDCEEGGA